MGGRLYELVGKQFLFAIVRQFCIGGVRVNGIRDRGEGEAMTCGNT